MASALSTSGPTSGHDVRHYSAIDIDEDDPFALPADSNPPAHVPAVPEGTTRTNLGLGLDDPIEPTRKPRDPRVKLDEDRLLSEPGLPELRRRAKRLKFRGRGNEFKDVESLLIAYQLWLDDLFPKARFADALVMVEKMGHKRRVQMARQEYIDETRRKRDGRAQSVGVQAAAEDAQRDDTVGEMGSLSDAGPAPRTPERHAGSGQVGNEDMYGATPLARRQREPTTTATDTRRADSLFGERTHSPPQRQQTVSGKAVADNASMDEDDIPDDLDALMAEAEIDSSSRDPRVDTTKGNGGDNPVPEDEFDDDMEALAEMGMW